MPGFLCYALTRSQLWNPQGEVRHRRSFVQRVGLMMSDDGTGGEERSYQRTLEQLEALEPLRELIWEMVGFTPEQAERNMKTYYESMKRSEAKSAVCVNNVRL